MNAADAGERCTAGYHVTTRLPYSRRKASIGSIFDARKAGPIQAIKATKRKSKLTANNVGASIGFVANNID
jgi:hypothetical protein